MTWNLAFLHRNMFQVIARSFNGTCTYMRWWQYVDNMSSAALERPSRVENIYYVSSLWCSTKHYFPVLVRSTTTSSVRERGARYGGWVNDPARSRV